MTGKSRIAPALVAALTSIAMGPLLETDMKRAAEAKPKLTEGVHLVNRRQRRAFLAGHGKDPS